jgi:hypothetical protein
VSEEEERDLLFLLDIKTSLLRNGIQSLLSLGLLEFEGNSLDWLVLDFLVDSGGEPSNLVLDLLALNVGDLLDDFFVDVEILGEFSVELLDNLSGGSLDDLILDSTHEFINFLIF